MTSVRRLDRLPEPLARGTNQLLSSSQIIKASGSLPPPLAGLALINGVALVRSQVEDNSQEETARLREATKRLFAQLKEMERRHQQEKERLQVGHEQLETTGLSAAVTHSCAVIDLIIGWFYPGATEPPLRGSVGSRWDMAAVA